MRQARRLGSPMEVTTFIMRTTPKRKAHIGWPTLAAETTTTTTRAKAPGPPLDCHCYRERARTCARASIWSWVHVCKQ